MESAQLKEALTVASLVTPTRPPTPAYSGCLLLASKTRLNVIGSDGETTIAARCDATVTTAGSVLLAPRPLLAFLSSIPAGTEITVNTADGPDVEVTATGVVAPYRFHPIAATLQMPPTSRKKPVPVQWERLVAAISAVRPAVSKEHNGIQLVSAGQGLSLRATDNYRIHAASLPEAGFGDFRGVIPSPVVERAAKLSITGVTVDDKAQTLRLEGPSVLVSARLLAVTVHEVDDYLDMAQPVNFELPTAPVHTALTRLAAVADQEDPVHVTVVGNTVTLKVVNPSIGSGEETITLPKPVTDEVAFAADRTYLTDAINAHDHDVLTVSYAAPLLPIILRSATPFPVVTIVQPVRVAPL